jgi:hypothetical protein
MGWCVSGGRVQERTGPGFPWRLVASCLLLASCSLLPIPSLQH